MAATPRRSGSDLTTVPAPFSYAQAAKGLSSSGTSAAATSKPSSGTLTPSKDAPPVTASAAINSVTKWSDDAEANEASPEKQGTKRERSNGPQTASKPASVQTPAAASIISSPDLGGSSSSTVTKDDDVSSVQNQSSESTWDNKSQASTSVEKPTETAQKTSDKVKGKDVERSTFKPLQEAPVPAVNFWKQRAEEAKAKAQKVGTEKPASTPSAIPNGSVSAPLNTGPKRAKNVAGAEVADTKDKVSVVETKAKGREEAKDRTSHPRKDSRPDAEPDKTKKGARPRPLEKDVKLAPNALPPPLDRDQESWPTPMSALDEDKKKVQAKNDKSEKERKESPSTRSHGKQEWVPVPYTPSVIFNTPLPSTATSRRGGRGGGRGGAQSSGRNGSGTNGTGASEKDAPATSSIPNGDQPKRGRPEGSAARDPSPAKDKRAASAGSVKAPVLRGDRSLKTAAGQNAEVPSSRASALTESAPSSQAVNQSNTFPRQYPSNRPSKAKRGDFPPGDRRKDGEVMSPAKDNTVPYDRRASTATQTEAAEDGERRNTFTEGQSGQTKQGQNDRRSFGTFSGRDRTRGGPRGTRGSYPNGQYSNGHTPQLQSSSTFPLRSPTAFHPDQNAYFPGPSGSGRGNFRGNARTQSVTTENMYSRVGGYPGGPQTIPHIQTYMPGMYDPMMQHPMSAVLPFSPFGMDQHTLISMVTTQLEYYFSVENLCKDIFLRKQMDSKGFVFLSVIAEFNRIKQLTTDMELIKFVCYSSATIEFRVGADGKDRLRRREGWEQWVLNISERDPSVQNDGPEELHNPPVPHPPTLEQGALPRYPEMPAGSPNGMMPFSNEIHYPPSNGMFPGGPQYPSVSSHNGSPNGLAIDGVNGSIAPNGHPIESSAKAANSEPDSFSDEQVETLSVIVRKQEQTQTSTPAPSAQRTFSNGSVDSKSGVPDEAEPGSAHQPGHKVNGTGPSQGCSVDNHFQDEPRRTLSPFVPASTPNAPPVRLYWVKGKDAPVESLPPDSTYESYTHLRLKALDQRQNAPSGTCPYDMDVLYQFWSHFLIRNFNSQMYDEFRHLAFDDAAQNTSNVGLKNLIKFYGESLLSTQTIIRGRVARHYVDLVKQEYESQGPAFRQLRSALRNGVLDPKSRKRIIDLLDTELRSSLEQ